MSKQSSGEWVTGYKVVGTKEDGTYRSYVPWLAQSSKRASVDYAVGKVTKPRGQNGPLAVFKTLNHARRFRADEGAADHTAVLEVLYELHVRDTDEGYVLYFIDKHGIKEGMSGLPAGTALASKVFPHRIVFDKGETE